MCQREYPQRERLLLYCSLKPCYSTSPCLLLLCCSVPPVQGQPQSITCFLGRVDRTNTCPLQVRPSSMIGVFIVQCMNACVSSWHQQVTPIVGETDWLFLIWVAGCLSFCFLMERRGLEGVNCCRVAQRGGEQHTSTLPQPCAVSLQRGLSHHAASISLFILIKGVTNVSPGHPWSSFFLFFCTDLRTASGSGTHFSLQTQSSVWSLPENVKFLSWVVQFPMYIFFYHHRP